MVQRTFTVRLRKDEESGYYAARCVELPEVISQGKTEEEAITNLREALELVLEEYESEAKKEGGKLSVPTCPNALRTDNLRAILDYRQAPSGGPSLAGYPYKTRLQCTSGFSCTLPASDRHVF
jgi:predicted RNase H-like HicB family nuclease